MAYRYVVLGAGRQGLAIAYDLGKFCQAETVLLADRDLGLAQAGADRVNRLLEEPVVSPTAVDARDAKALAALFQDCHGVVSAVPYYLNTGAARAAIEAKANFCDLGGNTEVVRQELELDKGARAAGMSIIPDCGLMPGMGNTLAVYAMSRLDAVGEVHIRCGGLPQNPKPPLDYKLVFSVEGLTNEYFGTAYVLREGEVREVPTFSELEEIEFPPPVGKCEAFVTSGGTSTCPWSFAGKVREYDYKTVRYPGHYGRIKTLLDLGFLDMEKVKIGDAEIRPRDLAHILIAKKTDFPMDKDLVVLRVRARGRKGGEGLEIHLDVMDFHDEQTGFSAMERTTGFPAGIVAHHQALGLCPKGAIPLEKAIQPLPFLADLDKRGIVLSEVIRKL